MPDGKGVAAVDPLGPDSLTWKYFGDLRTVLMGVWIGAIENMLPALGAGVEQHSCIKREPLQRVGRSVYPIMGVVYDGVHAKKTGTAIRDYHREIKGTDDQGRRYHALDPYTFYWAHATFFMLIIKLGEYFAGGFTEAEKRQLFEEHVQWFAMYGVSMRPVPKTWEDFLVYWDTVCRDELELNQATLDILYMKLPKPDFLPIPTKVWNIAHQPAIAAQRWIATGLFSPEVREKAGLRWTPGDEVLLRLFGKVVATAVSVVPDEVRLHPRAVQGFRRAEGKSRADAKPVDAPFFFDAPASRRHMPLHYVPEHKHPLLEIGNLVTGAVRTQAELVGATVNRAARVINPLQALG